MRSLDGLDYEIERAGLEEEVGGGCLTLPAQKAQGSIPLPSSPLMQDAATPLPRGGGQVKWTDGSSNQLPSTFWCVCVPAPFSRQTVSKADYRDADVLLCSSKTSGLATPPIPATAGSDFTGGLCE